MENAVAVNLPLVGTMRRNIRRQRRAAENALPVPATRAALPNPIPKSIQQRRQAFHF